MASFTSKPLRAPKLNNRTPKMAIGRFQIMATLQAARAHMLGLPLESALSWGLNRAIFYAAAKRGFKGTSPLSREFREARARPKVEAVDIYRLGDEMAFKEEREGKLYFTTGGTIQTEKDFKRQIESRFLGGFKHAWEEALETTRKFDHETILSGKAFFDSVYKPRRDEVANKWTELSIMKIVPPVKQNEKST